MSRSAMRPAILLFLVAATAAYRVLPVCKPVHFKSTLPRAASAPRASIPRCGPPTRRAKAGSQAQREKYMNAMQTGVADGGWDNDEYLQATKANPPTTSNMALLKQAEAWVKAMEEGDTSQRSGSSSSRTCAPECRSKS